MAFNNPKRFDNILPFLKFSRCLITQFPSLTSREYLFGTRVVLCFFLYSTSRWYISIQASVFMFSFIIYSKPRAFNNSKRFGNILTFLKFSRCLFTQFASSTRRPENMFVELEWSCASSCTRQAAGTVGSTSFLESSVWNVSTFSLAVLEPHSSLDQSCSSQHRNRSRHRHRLDWKQPTPSARLQGFLGDEMYSALCRWIYHSFAVSAISLCVARQNSFCFFNTT